MNITKSLENKLRKFARLAVKTGVNIQPGQMLIVNTSVDAKEFAKMVAEEAYIAGAGYVDVQFNEAEISKLHYQYASDKYLLDVPEWSIQKLHYLMDEKAARLSISSPNPEAFKGVDPARMAEAAKASAPKTSFFRKFSMASGSQWSIVAWPNPVWAKKVFPDKNEEEGMEALLDAILYASRVTDENDPVAEWEEHTARLANHSKILNDYHFKSLKFKNSAGTDMTIDLVEKHIWAGGAEVSLNGFDFAPNIPTEEVFSMPHSHGVNGRVVATLPLSYNGKLIENFYLDFKDGEVVGFGAEKEEDTLKYLLEMDEGSKRLGEVALISHDSPISNLNILFYNTLFDENASCHLALGNAYTMNIELGNELSEEELVAQGYNKSMVHVDFMFGSHDMEIDGVTYDGEVVPVFRKGNFVF